MQAKATNLSTKTSNIPIQARRNAENHMKKYGNKIGNTNNANASRKVFSHHTMPPTNKYTTYDASILTSTSKSISNRFTIKPRKKIKITYAVFLIILMIPVIISFSLILSSIHTNNEFVRRGTNYNANEISKQTLTNKEIQTSKPFRILHIITSLDEYENGERSTLKGSNRLINIVLPTLKSTLQSLNYEINNNHWEVDVYVILGYKCNEQCHALFQSVIAPYSVGLEIWDDAVPKNHGFWPEDKNQVLPMPYALARQHRFVVKDKLDYYDFFSSWVSFSLFVENDLSSHDICTGG